MALRWGSKYLIFLSPKERKMGEKRKGEKKRKRKRKKKKRKGRSSSKAKLRYGSNLGYGFYYGS